MKTYSVIKERIHFYLNDVHNIIIKCVSKEMSTQ